MIDKYKLFEKLDYWPHSQGQWDFHRSDARFRIPCCGRRYGKSKMAGMELTSCMFIPDTYWWIVGPNYKLGEKEFRVIHDNLVRKLDMGKDLKSVRYNAKQGDMRIEMPWNTILEVVSAERQESLLGEGLDGVIMSEAARHTRNTWEQYIEPALSDKRGIAIFPSTPRGFNWYNGLWNLGQYGNHPSYQSWRYPTWENLVSYPGGEEDPELERIRQVVSPAYWKQEYAAMFTTFEGQIYDEFKIEYHVKDITYQPQWRNFWALDFGFSDPFCCYDIMVDPADNVYVWREYQVRYLSTWDHAHILKERENPDGYHVDAIFGDPRGADEIAIMTPIVGPIAARSAEVGWAQGVEAIKRWLKLQPNGEPKMYIGSGCPELIRQMQALRAKDAKEEKNVKPGQHDYDDHGPDALRYFFTEFFVLGANAHLADVYDAPVRGSESETFFQLHSGTRLDTPIGY